MTNTQQISTYQPPTFRGPRVMHGWTEQTQVVVRARIRDRELEAASERLAASGRTTSSPIGVRRVVGRLLIRAGRRIAGEPVVTGSPAVRPQRPVRPMAA